MRLIGCILSLVVVVFSCGSSAQVPLQSYWALLKDDGRTWCGFKEEADFKSEAERLKPFPTETARLTYSSNRLMELTYQVQPESGDWIVVDKYTPSGSDTILRRANLLVAPNLQVIQEATIRQGKAEPFRIVSITTLDGKQAEASNIDFPGVEVSTNLSATPFMSVVSEMRRRSLTNLCKK